MALTGVGGGNDVTSVGLISSVSKFDVRLFVATDKSCCRLLAKCWPEALHTSSVLLNLRTLLREPLEAGPAAEDASIACNSDDEETG